MNDHLLKSNYLAGDKMTIADIYAAPFVALAEAVGSSLDGYPKVKAWLGRMKGLKSWQKVNEVIDGYAKSLKGPFETPEKSEASCTVISVTASPYELPL